MSFVRCAGLVEPFESIIGQPAQGSPDRGTHQHPAAPARMQDQLAHRVRIVPGQLARNGFQRRDRDQRDRLRGEREHLRRVVARGRVHVGGEPLPELTPLVLARVRRPRAHIVDDHADVPMPQPRPVCRRIRQLRQQLRHHLRRTERQHPRGLAIPVQVTHPRQHRIREPLPIPVRERPIHPLPGPPRQLPMVELGDDHPMSVDQKQIQEIHHDVVVEPQPHLGHRHLR